MRRERRFLADVMMIKLGRWLRILGIECDSPATEEETSDESLLRRALEGRLTLITMDRELARRASAAGADVILVPSTAVDVEEQLALVLKESGMTSETIKPNVLCARCGRHVRPASSEDVKGKVPDDVLAKKSDFWVCDGCGQAYWEGSHWRNIQKTVAKVRSWI